MEPVELAREQGGQHQSASVDALSLIREYEITSESDNEFAAGLLREVKARGKSVDEERRKITDLQRAALNSVNALFRPALDGYVEAEKILKGKIAAYVVARDAANRVALEIAGSADTPEVAEQALSTLAAAAPPAGVSIRQVWKFEVTDEALVPREYCSPDPKKIGAADPAVGVTGVRFYQEAQVASRKL